MKLNRYSARVAATFAGVWMPLFALLQAPSAQAQEKKVQERIGVYDSRAVAVAYAGSSFQQTRMRELQTRFKEAKERGDSAAVAQFEAEGKAWQTRLSQQGFSTAPVADLLPDIAAELPKIQEEAGVTTLISRWDRAELSKHPNAKQVDVTMRLVDAFHPNATQRKHAIDIQKAAPIKLKE